MRIVPVTLDQAKAFVAQHHRHNRAPVSWKFGAGLEVGGKLVGVAMAGRCVARGLDSPNVLEVTRVCTLGAQNACTRLYGAVCRAAAALGYRKVYAYTLQSEPGSSLKAAGFREDERLDARPTWNCAARHRTQTDLFGNETRPAEAKIRWVREL